MDSTPNNPTASAARSLSRRAFGVGALGAGALGALTVTGCSNEGRGSAAVGDNSDAVFPSHIPYKGIEFDLPGEDGVSDAMLTYPEKPKKVTEGTPGDGKDFGVFALTNNPAPPAMDKNKYWQELNKRLGCTMKVTVVPTGDFADRFQTTLAGDKLPEIFTFFPGDVPSLPAMLSAKAADLTDLLSGDAVKKYPFLANISTETWQACVYGGKIYGIPIPRGGMQSIVMYTRKDFLADKGVEVTSDSLEDFTDACRELTGGKQWALGGAPTQFVREMFEIPNGWSEADGKLTSANEHERQEDALEAVRAMVKDGLLHPDAFTADGPKQKTWVINGTTPLLQGTLTAWADFQNYPLPDGFRLNVLQPPKADGGGTAPIWHGPTSQNITSISKKAEGRAEALLDVLNYFAAPFGSEEYTFKMFGIEGVDHELKGTDPVLTEKGRNETQLALRYVGQGPWVNFTPGAPEVTKDQHAAEAASIPNAVKNPTTGLYSETQSRKGKQIGSALGDIESDIIQGRKPVSAWADAVATWKKNGGDAMKDEYEKALAEAADG
ncbi:extracellular solute-binding protein [Brachybacterium halotolerans subsp. kimchii]|uniref:extracellular solute-binding protein n=1 Tax=Brachybacterium halotolerans TaxID=2795215 RepID=UPI001E2C44F0|nr:extracellular solute-binding protein [Brachybacterium halotolerans]UEJ81407.1 extracellular solute-binding protein [Brachybacterium halotolerans subsp. kimchii]